MNVQELLQGIACSCGRHHSCPIDFVAVEKDAIRHLAQLARNYDNILIVADENTYAAAGEQTEAALAGKNVRRVIFPGHTVLIPDERAIAAVREQLANIRLLVGIGSGVIQDLCKYISHFDAIPYCIVATAPSMDGYASTGAAMILGGMKETVPVGLPMAILADTDVLVNAPMEMIRAGYGDIVGKFSALNDWKLSRVVADEYFCQRIYDLIYDMLQRTLALAQGLLNRDAESIGVLMEALIIVGIALSFVGSSRPASGSEHHLSHFFEITGIVHGEDYFPHGIDVAYSTVITAKLREELLTRTWPDRQYRPTKEAYAAQMQRIYGPVAEGCMQLQKKIGLYEKDMLSQYKAREPEIRKVLAEMPSHEQIEQLLAAVGMHMDTFDQFYGADKIGDAILYAKDLKDRYTVLWMYYDLFGGHC